jgi:hypothetical protein
MVTDLAALRRFSYNKTFIIGFGFLGISIIWPIFNQFVPIFLQAGNPEFTAQLLAEGRAVPDVVGFGLSPALALFIDQDNLINIFVQPGSVRARPNVEPLRPPQAVDSDRPAHRCGRLHLAALRPTALAVAAFILITNFGGPSAADGAAALFC